METTGTVRAYERISVEREESGRVERDRQTIKAWAAFKRPGWQVADYSDHGVSGRTPFRQRKEGGKLWRDLQRGDVLAVSKIDRAARNVSDLLDTVKRCEDIGATFVATEQDIDTSGPFGRFMLTLLAAIAELEAGMVGERVRDARRAFNRQGRWAMSPLPFGWHGVFDASKGWLVARPILTSGACDHCKDDDKQPVIHHAEGVKLRQAISAMLGGATVASQAKQLGISERNLGTVIRNTRLYGMPPGDSAVFDPDSALITKDQWLRLQSRIVKRQPWGKHDTLSAVFRCYKCGSPLYFDSAKNRYRCSHQPMHSARPTVNVAEADGFVEGVFLDWYGEYPEHQYIRVDSDKTRRLADVEIAIRDTTAAMQDRDADIDALDAQLRGLRAERKAIDEDTSEPSVELRETGRTWAEAWRSAATQAQRVDMVRVMGLYINVHPYSERHAEHMDWTDSDGSHHTRQGRFEVVELQA